MNACLYNFYYFGSEIEGNFFAAENIDDGASETL